MRFYWNCAVLLSSLVFLIWCGGQRATAQVVNPQLVGSWPGISERGDVSARDVAVAGDLAFIAYGQSGLQVIDVSDPAEPSLAGTYQPSAASSNNIAVQDSNVYVADGAGGIQVIDISDRSNPTRIGGLDDLGSVSNVALSIHSDPSVIPPFAVVITGGRHNIGSTLRFIDISNPTVLFEWETSSLQLTGVGRGIVARGGMAYVADSVEGLVIVRAQNPRFRGRRPREE